MITSNYHSIKTTCLISILNLLKPLEDVLSTIIESITVKYLVNQIGIALFNLGKLIAHLWSTITKFRNILKLVQRDYFILLKTSIFESPASHVLTGYKISSIILNVLQTITWNLLHLLNRTWEFSYWSIKGNSIQFF